jgi:hypothetical protein
MTGKITNFEFVAQIFEPMRDLLAAEKAGNSFMSVLPPSEKMAEDAIRSPDLWSAIIAKTGEKGKDAKNAHAALCLGAVKLIDQQLPLPPSLGRYILNVLLKECNPGRKHEYKTPVRDGRILAALTRLKKERGVNPTRSDDTRDNAGDESGSAIVAAVLRSNFG